MKFTDPANGVSSLSQQLKSPGRDLGAREHTALTNRCPEQPVERAMLDRIKAVEESNP